MDMPVHNIHGFCHASMGNVMAWQNSYYMTFVMLYEFCHAAWLLPYNPLFDPWHAVTPDHPHLKTKIVLRKLKEIHKTEKQKKLADTYLPINKNYLVFSFSFC